MFKNNYWVIYSSLTSLQIKENVDVPVIANGSITSEKDVEIVKEMTGVDGKSNYTNKLSADGIRLLTRQLFNKTI